MLTLLLTHSLGEHLQISESIIGKIQSNLYIKWPVFKVPFFAHTNAVFVTCIIIIR